MPLLGFDDLFAAADAARPRLPIAVAGAADATVLMLCVAPELDPRFGRLYAYLHDDVTRKLATPRLVARLAAGDGVSSDDVLMRFDRSAPLSRVGALRILDQASQTPLADRPVSSRGTQPARCRPSA